RITLRTCNDAVAAQCCLKASRTSADNRAGRPATKEHACLSNPLQTTREWAEGIEDRRKTALVRGFAAIGCPFMFGFGVVSLLHARWALAIVLLGGTALVAALALTPWAARHPRRSSGALAAFAFLLGSYLLVTGGHAGTGKIGRASCRERVESWGGAGAVKTRTTS